VIDLRVKQEGYVLITVLVYISFIISVVIVSVEDDLLETRLAKNFSHRVIAFEQASSKLSSLYLSGDQSVGCADSSYMQSKVIVCRGDNSIWYEKYSTPS